MRVEASVTSVSWIPSEAVTGAPKLGFDAGLSHYDPTPPDVLGDLGALNAADSFRFANELKAFVEVEDGRVVDHGQSGGLHIGATKINVAGRTISVPAVGLPELTQEPVVGPTSVQFFQTVGGRTGAPLPRRISKPPFVRITAPLVWTTLSLIIEADGSARGELIGASQFPRHWVYDSDGRLTAKSGVMDFSTWSHQLSEEQTPWGQEDSPAIVTEVESALERELSTTLMRGGKKPSMRRVKEGDALVEQGDKGDELFLLLDGVLRAEVDGEALAEYGPGAILGERALIEGGRRTSTLRALTSCRVAAVQWPDVDGAQLAEVSKSHRHEEQRR